MSTAPKPAYVEIQLTCPHCQIKNTVHVLYMSGFSQPETEMIACKKCDKGFEAMVPNKIVGGPFLI
jgi:transcription elongation factor Elf1